MQTTNIKQLPIKRISEPLDIKDHHPNPTDRFSANDQKSNQFHSFTNNDSISGSDLLFSQKVEKHPENTFENSDIVSSTRFNKKKLKQDFKLKFFSFAGTSSRFEKTYQEQQCLTDSNIGLENDSQTKKSVLINCQVLDNDQVLKNHQIFKFYDEEE